MSWSSWSSWPPLVGRRRLAAAVVLGRPAAEDRPEGPAVADQETADVVGLEEPLVRIDGHRIGAIEVPDPIPVAVRQSGASAVGRVDVEPQVLRGGDVGKLADRVD